MTNDALREGIMEMIGIRDVEPRITGYKIINSTKKDRYTENRIEFESPEDKVPAFLLVPDVRDKNPAILLNHQHNAERNLGKSEVCGLAGNPLQAFGPALAKEGFVVLAHDSVCFEDRRRGTDGILPLPGDGDFLQHFNEMCRRILYGGNLMKKVLSDAMLGISLLQSLDFVDKAKIGALGHSYGGTTVLFHMALDKRISYGCASGSAGTYRSRLENNVGIEFSSVIPGFCGKYDFEDIVSCAAPRPLLIVSADDDKYSKDADFIVEHALRYYMLYNAGSNLFHKRYTGGHALTKERHNYILDWLLNSRQKTAGNSLIKNK